MNSRLETRSIYIFGSILAPRQLLIILASLLIGYLFSIPVPGTVSGIPFLGKLIVVGFFALAGFLVSSKRVKMVPPEMVILYRLTKYTGTTAETGKKGEKSKGRMEKVNRKEKEEEVEMLPIEDFMHPTPYNVSGKVRVDKRLKLTLFLDNSLLDEQAVSPSMSQYWFVYLAKAEQIGTHELLVKAEGRAEPLFRKTIAVFPKGRELMLEMKKQ